MGGWVSVDFDAAAPLVSATPLASGIGIAVNSTTALLNQVMPARHRSRALKIYPRHTAVDVA